MPTMTYPEALRAIEALKPGGMKWGLARMQRILALCGSPERRLRCVHIAGTNGKGSTARMIQSILTAAGWRTGLYASPAVTGLRDTITMDGQPIPEAAFASLTAELLSHDGEMGQADRLSEFELTTALAFLYFARSRTDLCVIECGLGGRDDATNVLPPPLAAVLTPVSLDHTAVLGGTVAEIAENKCGILKPPCAVITSPAQDPEALAVLMEQAARRGLTVRIPARSGRVLEETLGRTAFTYDGMVITLPLTGGFQRDNALTAIETVRALAPAGFSADGEAIRRGLAAAAMPCRQEALSLSPLVLLDGAHNPQGVAALAETLRRHRLSGLTLVAGMLRDKDAARCAALLAPCCRRAICCTPPNPRALPAAQFAKLLHAAAPGLPVEAVDDPSAALDAALGDTAGPGRVSAPEAGGAGLLVAGSFYVAAALRPRLLAWLGKGGGTGMPGGHGAAGE